MPIDDAIDNIMCFISKNTYHEFISFGFSELLKLVLRNNYFYHKFTHNNRIFYSFYSKVLGVSMGAAAGPNTANLYLQFYEIKYESMLNQCLY